MPCSDGATEEIEVYIELVVGDLQQFCASSFHSALLINLELSLVMVILSTLLSWDAMQVRVRCYGGDWNVHWVCGGKDIQQFCASSAISCFLKENPWICLLWWLIEALVELRCHGSDDPLEEIEVDIEFVVGYFQWICASRLSFCLMYKPCDGCFKPLCCGTFICFLKGLSPDEFEGFWVPVLIDTFHQVLRWLEN